MDKRLEAGWFQRLAWSVLAVGSFGLLVWVPFLYVAIRRGRGADWGAFASFVLYELITLPWASTQSDSGDPVLGATAVATMAIAVWLLLFPLFDKPTPRNAMVGAGLAQGPWPGQAPGNPYLR
ncbi:hypothetical protein ABZX90_15155 [Streptomyces sp. NPDC002935]|uniref:hypothetical protein n=1 Tax=unclassified Streptomyces TaxID=2593676 RepID=UPI0033315C7E